MEVEKVLERAREAKANGSSRFCMGAAWRNPKEKDMPYILRMIEEVRGLGMETCMTLGMLTADQAARLGRRGSITTTTTRHLAGVLRRHHHHPHLSGQARHPGACAAPA
jgi:biotin synthase-like enzyme